MTIFGTYLKSAKFGKSPTPMVSLSTIFFLALTPFFVLASPGESTSFSFSRCSFEVAQHDGSPQFAIFRDFETSGGKGTLGLVKDNYPERGQIGGTGYFLAIQSVPLAPVPHSNLLWMRDADSLAWIHSLIQIGEPLYLSDLPGGETASVWHSNTELSKGMQKHTGDRRYTRAGVMMSPNLDVYVGVHENQHREDYQENQELFSSELPLTLIDLLARAPAAKKKCPNFMRVILYILEQRADVPMLARAKADLGKKATMVKRDKESGEIVSVPFGQYYEDLVKEIYSQVREDGRYGQPVKTLLDELKNPASGDDPRVYAELKQLMTQHCFRDEELDLSKLFPSHFGHK